MHEAWLNRLQGRLAQAPARPRAVLELAWPELAAPASIGSIEPALALRMARAGLPMRDFGEAWRIAAPSLASVDSVLAAMAQWLRENDLAAAWRDELLPVTDALGTGLGRIERAAVRPLGIATQAVHLVATDARGRVWVQQRAFDKATDPGLWDTTVGGLTAADESIAQTLARETWEEAGLHVAELSGMAAMGRLTVRRPVAEGYMVEHIAMFEAVVPQGQVPVNQDGEVERFECLDRETLIERLHADAFTLEAGMILSTWLQRQSPAAD